MSLTSHGQGKVTCNNGDVAHIEAVGPLLQHIEIKRVHSSYSVHGFIDTFGVGTVFGITQVIEVTVQYTATAVFVLNEKGIVSMQVMVLAALGKRLEGHTTEGAAEIIER